MLFVFKCFSQLYSFCFLKIRKKELNIMSVVLGPYLFVFFLCFLFSVGRERGLGVDKVYLVMKYFF